MSDILGFHQVIKNGQERQTEESNGADIFFYCISAIDRLLFQIKFHSVNRTSILILF